jgi:perosamine synthetase
LTALERLAPEAPTTWEFIPLTQPELQGNEWTYVKQCLDTGWVSSAGAFVERFEQAVAGAVGARHAVATVNGTAALHIALLVAGVQPDDEVLVSTLSFIAPANAIRYVGAWPVFVDAEPAYWQIDPDKALDFLERHCEWREGALWNSTTRRRVRAVIPVHILGHPVDLEPLRDACRRYRITIIEDATESLGATYRGRPVGHLGDIACFSFNGNKLITTGGGGMLVTGHEDWARRARYLTTQAKDDPTEYVHGAVGYNYRLTNLQAALGVAQMERVGAHLAAKRRIADVYNERLGAIPGIAPMREAPWARSAWWMYSVLVDQAAFGIDSRALLRRLAGARIQTRPLWQPLHLSAPHRAAYATDCSVAERLNRLGLSLPCSVGLTEADQSRVIEQIAASP